MKKNQPIAKGKNKRISLKWKWTLGASIALFVMYTFFSTVLFIGFRRVMFSNEERVVSQTTTYLTERLGLKSSNLTEESIQDIFTLREQSENVSGGQVGSQPNLLETGAASVFENSLNAQLNDRQTVIRVYDADMKLIYAPEYSPVPFSPSKELHLKEVVTDDRNALTAIAPVKTAIGDRLIGYVQVIDGLYEYHALSETIVLTIIWTGVFAIIFSMLLGYVVASNFLRPINRVTQAMRMIEEEPQSTARINISGRNDELSDMGVAYNNMMDRMQRNIEGQKEFVEDVSHELRTPVAVVEGHLKLLNRWGKDDPEILEESLQASLQEIVRMKSLVQEMLDLSRAGQVEIHYKDERIAIKEVIQQTVNNFQMIHPDFEFILDNQLKEDVHVNIYRNHLEQILIILLDNAVKYSLDRKEVHVSTATEKGEVHIAIQDYGEGMTQEDTVKIFNRFYRIDKARARVTGGNGLGLSIAQELITGYKGKIWAESALNYGSIFRIILPIKEETEEVESLPNDLLIMNENASSSTNKMK